MSQLEKQADGNGSNVRKSRTRSWPWLFLLVVIIVCLGAVLCHDIRSPWRLSTDYNAVVWCQAAHNFLRAGVIETGAVPSSYHFGPLPIPPGGYYVHHPPLFPLVLTVVFALFGEHEWVARLVPILATLASVLLLWIFVRDHWGARAATFAAALFAATPMVMHYGRMVNFEPCTLPLMLLALIALARRHDPEGRRWWLLAVASCVAAMWTAWLGYFFTLAVAIHFFRQKNGAERLRGLLLVGLAAGSAALFCLQVTLVEPTAWDDMRKVVAHRVGAKDPFTWMQWARFVGGYTVSMISPSVWLLAVAGAVLCARNRRARVDGELFPARAASWLIGMNAAYMLQFRNASFNHEFAAWYFAVPAAILGAAALERSLQWARQSSRWKFSRYLVRTAIPLLLLAIAASNFTRLPSLRTQLPILDGTAREPPFFAMSLGRLIRTSFSGDTVILCNLNDDFLPLVSYYAQRTIIPGLTLGEHWQNALKDLKGPRGGVIWLGEPNAVEPFSVLPQEERRQVFIEEIPFCLWQPTGNRGCALR